MLHNDFIAPHWRGVRGTLLTMNIESHGYLKIPVPIKIQDTIGDHTIIPKISRVTYNL